MDAYIPLEMTSLAFLAGIVMLLFWFHFQICPCLCECDHEAGRSTNPKASRKRPACDLDVVAVTAAVFFSNLRRFDKTAKEYWSEEEGDLEPIGLSI